MSTGKGLVQHSCAPTIGVNADSIPAISDNRGVVEIGEDDTDDRVGPVGTGGLLPLIGCGVLASMVALEASGGSSILPTRTVQLNTMRL